MQLRIESMGLWPVTQPRTLLDYFGIKYGDPTIGE
jgi:hypothetical protein